VLYTDSEGGIVAVTSIDIDQADLELARQLTGAGSNREVVRRALKTLIAVQRQPAAVERIIARRFTEGQTNGDTIDYAARAADD
jgi:hypothetical protein